ncbi:uncharacterized protein At2g39795, mitochondrial-like [Salvia miltiorrhiza]|uniref:uncharacterized protein At2g39795, mitochondrial-like n=1 Tax=Salvia miltiorrhiza TaxID=226208 RepID=UPI0025ACACCF|nr:uncharacterized protein At2g39795, mitochondrial-like [Salvia miltiorrhiza]
MVLNSVIRRASRVVPLAIRASAGSQRYLHNHHHGAAVRAAVNQTSRNFFPRVFHHYSTKPKSDELLLRVLKSEIIETQTEEEIEIPESFPFHIIDVPCPKETITLVREYNRENISVEVQIPDVQIPDEDDRQITQYCLPMLIKVSKPNSPSLEFSCGAYFDGTTIDSMSIKDPEVSEDQIAYEGPDFGDLDENLQKAFHKYLEIRGITPTMTALLCNLVQDCVERWDKQDLDLLFDSELIDVEDVCVSPSGINFFGNEV